MALLANGTRIFGTANVDTSITVGSNSTTVTAINATSNTGYGVYSTSNSSIAVFGVSTAAQGGYFVSNSGTALYAQSNTGRLALFSNNTNTIATINSSSVYSNVGFTSSVNNQRLSFTPVAGGANVYFNQQNDDNFVFYSTNTSNQPRAIWSIFGNNNTSNLTISVPLNVQSVFIANSTQVTTTVPFSANASVGTAGQVLVSNGATGSPFWSSAVRSGTAVATTSGTSVDYLSIPSYVKRITVMYNGFSTSSTSNYLIQLITGASTVVSTGYVSSCRSATSTAGFLTVDGPSAASLTSGSITISNLSGNIWVSSGNLQISGGVVYYSAGIISLAAALTGVRITSVTPDTLDAGSVNILYE